VVISRAALLFSQFSDESGSGLLLRLTAAKSCAMSESSLPLTRSVKFSANSSSRCLAFASSVNRAILFLMQLSEIRFESSAPGRFLITDDS
jgi:hypothetical protein